MSEKRLELVRGLGPAAAMAMVVGHIIGTGVFLVPSAMARATGSAGLVFLVWIVSPNSARPCQRQAERTFI